MMTIFMFALLVCGVFGDEVKSVMEGDSVTLHTELNGTQRDEILWRFGPKVSSILLVHIDGTTPEITKDERFKDRLQISDIQNGDLIIKNVRKKHAGLYRAEMVGAAATPEKKFNVIVYDASDEIDCNTGEVKSVSVTEGESVPLNTDVNLQKDALIVWRFGPKNVLIAKDDTEDNNTPEYPDERFKDRLQVNNQTGDLTISKVTNKDSGDYKLKISSNRQIIHKTFSVSIRGVFGDEVKSVMEGDSLTLHTHHTEIQREDIKWWFGPEGSSILLVHINGTTPEITNDERFKDRLQADIQTGDLIIKNMRKNHAGLYRAEIEGAAGTVRKFNVHVYDVLGEIDVDTGEVKSVSVTEGESVPLNTDVKLQKDALILWRFGHKNVLIAKYDTEDNNTSEYPDERFKDRLQLNDQTGDLIISNVRTEDSGDYKLKISSNNQIIHKTFSVSVSSGEGDKALTCILVIAALVAVLVAWCFHRRSSQLKVQEKFVEEGESVTLSPDAIKGFIFRDGVIKYKYGDKGIIAENNTKDNTIFTYDGDDERFKDRLKLNNETGDLIIRDLKTKHSGLYKLKITSSRGWPFSILGASSCQFNVIVTERIKWVKDEDSVILHTDVKELKTSDEILWMYGAEDTRIAKFTVGTERPVLDLYTDDRFRNRLEINPQTGDLTIKDITPECYGLYRALIYCDKRSTYRRFRVSILVYPKEGGPVGLKTGAQIQKGDQVEWSFRDDSSKRISNNNITLVTGVNGDRNKTKYPNKRFKGRLEMNPETGDLTIRDIRQTDEGVYTLKLINTDGKIIHRVFRVMGDGELIDL